MTEFTVQEQELLVAFVGHHNPELYNGPLAALIRKAKAYAADND